MSSINGHNLCVCVCVSVYISCPWTGMATSKKLFMFKWVSASCQFLFFYSTWKNFIVWKFTLSYSMTGQSLQPSLVYVNRKYQVAILLSLASFHLLTYLLTYVLCLVWKFNIILLLYVTQWLITNVSNINFVLILFFFILLLFLLFLRLSFIKSSN